VKVLSLDRGLGEGIAGDLARVCVDVLNARYGHRVLDRSGNAAGLGAVGRHDVVGVADHEDAARLGLGDQFRHHPTVGAGDELGFRGLEWASL
jgi:hypothetical protein